MADAGSLLQASVIFLLTAVVMVPLAKQLASLSARPSPV